MHDTKDLILKQRSALVDDHGMDSESTYEEVESALFRETFTDFDDMLSFLPVGVSSFLDIGCGVGAIDVLLSRRYQGATVYVLDTEEPSPEEGRRYSYGPASKFRALGSRPLTLAFLSRHGVDAQWVSIGEPLPAVDLVVSLSSWGWHYPVDEYASQVKAKTVILDIREDSEGVQAMEAAGFTHAGTIPKASKGAREVFHRSR